MASDIFKNAMKRVPQDNKKFISNSFEINNYIHQVLKEKGLTQKYLAQKLGKSESEISKILSPGHNLTLRTLSKIEVALDTDIVETPKLKDRASVKVNFGMTMVVDSGDVIEPNNDFFKGDTKLGFSCVPDLFRETKKEERKQGKKSL